MTSTFPTSTALPGLTFSVLRTPEAATLYRARESGRDTSLPKMTYPLHAIELQYSVLRESTTPAFTELQTIAGFFLSRRGSYESFYFSDPIDNSISSGAIGTGNGVNRTFQFSRAVGPSFTEPVDVINALTGVTVGGVAVGSSLYSIVQPNFLQFSTAGSAPALGSTVRASFTFYYLMRFAEDQSQFEQFMQTLYMLKKCRLRSAHL